MKLLRRVLFGPFILFITADQSIPVSQVNAFDAALTESGVPHAFVEDADGVRSGGAQAEAWNQRLSFLETNLKDVSTRAGGIATDYRSPFTWKYYVLLVYEHTLGMVRHTH